MIILISTLVSLAIVVAAAYYKENIILIALFIPGFIGYGLLASLIEVEYKTSNKIVTPICSKELGLCRLIIDKEVYEVDDYKVVDFFVNNPRTELYTFYNHLNSYGIVIRTEMQLPNSIVYTLKTIQ